MSDDQDDHYAFDGMYFNPNCNWLEDDWEWRDEDAEFNQQYGYEEAVLYDEYEISVNVPSVSQASESGGEECQHIKSNLINLRHENKTKEATKLIASINNKEQILNKIIKKLFHENLDYMIIQYSKTERVSFDYIKIAKQHNCLRILIANYLKNVGDYSLTRDINDEIDDFIETISRNDDLETAYQRVHRIQKFIHDKIDQKHGKGRHFSLPVKEIKSLLSTARLYLNIQDFTYKDVNSLSRLIDQSNQQSVAEIENPAKGTLPNGKKYIKSWRAGHMKATLSKKVEIKVNEMLKLDKDLSTDTYINLIIDIYARD